MRNSARIAATLGSAIHATPHQSIFGGELAAAYLGLSFIMPTTSPPSAIKDPVQ